jgi:hypothetical protein
MKAKAIIMELSLLKEKMARNYATNVLRVPSVEKRRDIMRRDGLVEVGMKKLMITQVENERWLIVVRGVLKERKSLIYQKKDLMKSFA